MLQYEPEHSQPWTPGREIIINNKIIITYIEGGVTETSMEEVLEDGIIGLKVLAKRGSKLAKDGESTLFLSFIAWLVASLKEGNKLWPLI